MGSAYKNQLLLFYKAGCGFLFIEHNSAGQTLSIRRGRPGLTVKTVGLIAVGFPAANSLSLIFVRIGYRLNGLPYTIPDSMPGSLDCNAWGLVAVGTTVARRPPHSPVLALLTHTVLTLDWGIFGVETHRGIRLQDLDWRYQAAQAVPKAGPA